MQQSKYSLSKRACCRSRTVHKNSEGKGVGLRSTLPFMRLPILLTERMVYFSNSWLNNFPKARSVCKTIFPREVVIGWSLNAANYCRYEFGAYSQTFEEPSPSNSMQERTIGAICVGPTRNIQGSYHFMSLNSGRCIT